MYKLTVDIEKSGKITTDKKEYITVYENKQGYKALEDAEGVLEVIEPKNAFSNILGNVAEEITVNNWLNDEFLGLVRFFVYTDKPEYCMIGEMRKYINEYFSKQYGFVCGSVDLEKIALGVNNGQHTAEA